MFSFGNLTVFGGWSVKGESRLTAEDLASISSAEVVSFPFGKAVNFYMVNGGHKSIVCSANSKLELGDKVDPAKGKVLTLSKEGEDDIYRWQED